MFTSQLRCPSYQLSIMRGPNHHGLSLTMRLPFPAAACPLHSSTTPCKSWCTSNRCVWIRMWAQLDRPIGTPPVTPHHLPHLLFTYPVPVETVSTLTLSAPLVELRLRPPWLPLSSFFTATAFLEAAVEAQACTLKFLKAVQKHSPMSAAAL